jgi:hypothetical protein
VTSRNVIFDLIDELPESALPEVERYLVSLRDKLTPEDAEVDHEPLLPETEAMIAESRAAYARGEGISTAELLDRLCLPPLGELWRGRPTA